MTTPVQVTIETTVQASPEQVWERFTQPEHIMQWSFAGPDWHAPSSTNDLRAGGAFSTRMEAKDGSFGFDFVGVYDEVKPLEYIAYTLGDGRKVSVSFSPQESGVHITQQFEAETENPVEMQQTGWQMILDNFKKYAEQA